VRQFQKRVGVKKIYSHIKPALAREKVKLGRDKLFDLLRAEDLLVERKKRYQRTTYSNHNYAVAPNRIKNLEISHPNQVFVSDITYVTLKNRFAYLFLVTDAYARKIVGYHLSLDLDHNGALLALDMALRKVKDPRGIIHHSDRGCQYCCHEFLQYLAAYGMCSSMTDEAHCYQNAIAERVNGILKDEFDVDLVFDNFNLALSAIRRAIKIYNTKRLHWALDLKTPEAIYQATAPAENSLQVA
jgi:putative transposase